MTRSAAIRKARALLRLAQGHDHEAETARAHAARIMRSYHLSEADVRPPEVDPVTTIHASFDAPWFIELAGWCCAIMGVHMKIWRTPAAWAGLFIGAPLPTMQAKILYEHIVADLGRAYDRRSSPGNCFQISGVTFWFPSGLINRNRSRRDFMASAIQILAGRLQDVLRQSMEIRSQPKPARGHLPGRCRSMPGARPVSGTHRSAAPGHAAVAAGGGARTDPGGVLARHGRDGDRRIHGPTAADHARWSRGAGDTGAGKDRARNKKSRVRHPATTDRRIPSRVYHDPRRKEKTAGSAVTISA